MLLFCHSNLGIFHEYILTPIKYCCIVGYFLILMLYLGQLIYNKKQEKQNDFKRKLHKIQQT